MLRPRVCAFGFPGAAPFSSQIRVHSPPQTTNRQACHHHQTQHPVVAWAILPVCERRFSATFYQTYVATDSDGNAVVNAFPWYRTRNALSKFPTFAVTSATFPSGRKNATVESCSASLD